MVYLVHKYNKNLVSFFDFPNVRRLCVLDMSQNSDGLNFYSRILRQFGNLVGSTGREWGFEILLVNVIDGGKVVHVGLETIELNLVVKNVELFDIKKSLPAK